MSSLLAAVLDRMMNSSEQIDIVTILAPQLRWSQTILAQLVERVAFNHKAAGSSPAGGIFFLSYKQKIPSYNYSKLLVLGKITEYTPLN